MKPILCILGVHRWVYGFGTRTKGKHWTFYESICTECGKTKIEKICWYPDKWEEWE